MRRQVEPSTVEFSAAAPAVQVGRLVFTKGLTARNARGYTVGIGDCAAQVAFCFEQMQDLMTEVGGTLASVVHVRTFISDASHIPILNTAIEEWFPEARPATSVFMYTNVLSELLVEIEAIAVVPSDDGDAPTPIRTVCAEALEPGTDVSACQVGDLLFLSSLSARDPSGNIASAGSTREQADVIFRKMEAVLAEAGTSMGNVVKLLTYVTDPPVNYLFYETVQQRWFPEEPPASTIVVAPPAYQGQRVQVEAVAVMPGHNGRLPARRVVQSAGVGQTRVRPAAVQAGEVLFLSGLTSRDSEGNFVESGSCGRQVAVIFDTMQRVLREAGASTADVVKLLTFLRDPLDYPSFNDVRQRWFPLKPPAGSAIIACPVYKELLVEIDVIALVQNKVT